MITFAASKHLELIAKLFPDTELGISARLTGLRLSVLEWLQALHLSHKVAMNAGATARQHYDLASLLEDARLLLIDHVRSRWDMG